MDVTLQDIETYLSEVKAAVKHGRYRIDQNDRRQDNLDLFLKYIIDEARAKEILLSLTAIDFSEIRRNEHKGFEHELLYVFGKDVTLLERGGTEVKMAERGRMDFCIECRKDTEYILQKRPVIKTIKEKEYSFNITVAVCAECGEKMSIPGLIDKNVQEIDKQYRAAEGIVTIDDIEKMMKIYKIGKAPLSLALGFGEVTITRYLTGQIPSKEYSDVMRSALSSPAYMKALLMKNKDKIADAAYNKAISAAIQLENLFAVSDKMLRVISYVFEALREVTPLMLQKLLYFIQGTSYALYNQPMFEEDCEAWAHGPVYPEVYDLFRDFKYNPIDDARFAILDGTVDKLTDEERKAIDLVINTFGLYGGRALERITHNEVPWKNARRGFGEKIPSNEPISKESIKSYYKAVNREYGIDSESGLNRYIQDMLLSFAMDTI